jgi:hypothetical protein
MTFLVDETLRLQKSGECELSGLELKLNDYGLNFLKGEFIPQSQILRFRSPVGNLDMPVNWSIFSMENPLVQYTILDAGNDVDNFFFVMKSVWTKQIEKILITHDDGFCYIVGLGVGEESHMHDLLSPQEWFKSA